MLSELLRNSAGSSKHAISCRSLSRSFDVILVGSDPAFALLLIPPYSPIKRNNIFKLFFRYIHSKIAVIMILI
jgi:hypothetical protein